MKGNKKELIIGVIIIGVIVLAAITVALILLTTGKTNDEKIKSLTLDQTTISEEVIIGGEKVAALTAITKNITEELVWSSSNEKVAVVEADGETAVITLKAEGTATITVKAGELTAECQVAVKEVESRIVIAPSEIEEGIVKGTTKVVTLAATLENLEGDITWSVDNDKVATIVGNGETAELTLKGVGNAVVTAKVGDKTATCNVKVNDVTSMITLKTTNIKREINRGDTYSQTLEVTLLNVKGELKWTSSNTKVAKVEKTSDTKAKVTLVGEGKAVVTVTDGNVKATCSVNVTHPEVKLEIKPTTITKTIITGVAQTFKDELTATLTNATGTINWISSNTSVATVSKTGATVSINALEAGTTTITATCKVGTKTYSAKCTITVKEITPSISLNKTSITKTIITGVHQTFKNELTATLTNATGTITWTSSDESVATVTKTGTTASITALKAGTTTITASFEVEGRKYYSKPCTVEVEEIVPKITLKSSKNQELGFGDVATIEVSVEPANVKLKWDIDKPGNSTIEEQTNTKLKLKSNSEGKATVTVSYGSDKVAATVEWKRPTINNVALTKGQTTYYVLDNGTAKLEFKADVKYLGNNKVKWDVSGNGSGSSIEIGKDTTTATLTINGSGQGDYKVYAYVYADEKTYFATDIVVKRASIRVTSDTNNPGRTTNIHVYVDSIWDEAHSGGQFRLISGWDIMLNGAGAQSHSRNVHIYDFYCENAGTVNLEFKISGWTKKITVECEWPDVDCVIPDSATYNSIRCNATKPDISGYSIRWDIFKIEDGEMSKEGIFKEERDNPSGSSEEFEYFVAFDPDAKGKYRVTCELLYGYRVVNSVSKVIQIGS